MVDASRSASQIQGREFSGIPPSSAEGDANKRQSWPGVSSFRCSPAAASSCLTRRNCHYDWYKNRGQITRFIVHRHVTVEEPCSRIVRNHVRNRGHWGEAISVLHLPPQKRSPRRIMCRNLWASNSDTARSRDTRGADNGHAHLGSFERRKLGS